MSIEVLPVAMAVLFVATTLQGSVGFGANVIAAPLLVLLDPLLVPGPVLVAVLGLNLLVLWRDRGSVTLGPVGQALIGRVVGTGLGVVAAVRFGPEGLMLSVALTVLAAAAATAFGRSIGRSAPSLLAAGTLSGFGATTAGIGGPPVALVFADSEGAELRGSLSAFFVVGALMSLAGLAVAGWFGPEEIKRGLALLPASIGGFLCSRWTIPFLDRGRTRPVVLAVSVAAALGLLFRLALG